MLYVILAVVILLVLFVINSYNGLVKLRNKVKANWAQIDVVLKRRADLIPNLVETVKGYASHEQSTLESVIQARNSYVSASTPEQQMESAGAMSQALSKLMVLSESYPELKANTNFLELQDTLKETEDKIQYARQFYNDSVYTYTNKIESFPSSIIAGIFGFAPFGMFEAAETDRSAPTVSF